MYVHSHYTILCVCTCDSQLTPLTNILCRVETPDKSVELSANMFDDRYSEHVEMDMIEIVRGPASG